MKFISYAFQRIMSNYGLHIIDSNCKVHGEIGSSRIIIGDLILTMGKRMEVQESDYNSWTTYEEGEFLRGVLTNNYLSKKRSVSTYIETEYTGKWDLSAYRILTYGVPVARNGFYKMYILYDKYEDIKQVILDLGINGLYSITTKVTAKVNNSNLLDALLVISENACKKNIESTEVLL